ncbi:DUF2309 domain-containing protein [Roseivivax isoporae]|uniref:Probable inorganic carbon transporter subunit DabA n=1 Tax=Roseivivax isoporae LMG 25204 TaxID=1449351 RepID=X7F3L9_9RHOB|nr:DUF2309 domain-containing protein [Roseivivax isoporae]ETX27492.1 hypothetical protein RISW2_13775 [Roseivivax isoporae LMG 25204]
MSIAHVAYSGQTLALFACADAAAQHVPPAFPLSATVAVNPYLGQVAEDRATAAARLSRVGGGRLFLPRASVAHQIADGTIVEADLAAAAAAHGLAPADLRAAAAAPEAVREPVPTLADLAAREDRIDWPGLVEDRLGLWAAAQFDRGQAFWPAPEGPVFATWRSFAARDLTPGLAGLAGFAERADTLPADPRHAFALLCGELDVAPDWAPVYFHRLLMTLGGWAQYARHIDWTAARDGERSTVLFDLLTARLAYEAAFLARGGATLASGWEETRAACAAPVVAGPEERADAALQDAADRAAERALAARLVPAETVTDRPDLQAAFCIDVRSEPFRRALEAADPGMRTLGFAGFFGVAVSHRPAASDLVEARAPILLRPGLNSVAALPDGGEAALRIHRRAIRAWGRFKRAAVSAFAFVEAAGPLYIGKLVREALGLGHRHADAPAPRIDMTPEARSAAAAQVLRSMSLTDGFARLVLIAGHGAGVTNAPHASALQCGACGGHAGDVNARLLAALLNDPEARAGLAAEGIEVPRDTQFVAGLHDTVSDEVHLYAADLPHSHREDLARLRRTLSRAAALARTARAAKLPRGAAGSLAARGRDWSELRPEWGLAGCAAFVAAPRHRSAGGDLGGRVFLHDYDWRQDPDAATLELILSAPVVVASWIALQYHGSTVAPHMFGAGNKLLHNVVGGVGVLEGNGGLLRAGLPVQSVHDGETARHDPVRLSVAVEAPAEMLSRVLDRQPGVRALFDNGWLALLAMDDRGRVAQRYEGGGWTAFGASPDRAARAAA